MENKMKKVGAIVKKSRKEQGLTQEQLAAIAGVGVRFIRELEQGKESCHMGKAITTLSILGLPMVIGGDTL